MPKRGQPTKLTPDAHRTIVESVAQGSVYELAAIRVGLSVSCIYKWLAKGRKSKSPKDVYFQFFHALKRAEGDRALLALARIGKAAQGGAVLERTTITRDGVVTVKEKLAQPQWTADAWLLERLHSKFYASNNHEAAVLRKQLAELKKLVPPPEALCDDGESIRESTVARAAAILLSRQPQPNGSRPEPLPQDPAVDADAGGASPGLPL